MIIKNNFQYTDISTDSSYNKNSYHQEENNTEPKDFSSFMENAIDVTISEPARYQLSTDTSAYASKTKIDNAVTKATQLQTSLNTLQYKIRQSLTIAANKGISSGANASAAKAKIARSGILSNAGQSIVTQANSDAANVLSLLQ